MQQIREYKITHKIGEGGMGEVYLALDENLGRKVAIKMLAPELLRNAELIERFKQEAKLQASLIHPKIVSLFTFFKENDSIYMVLEYAPGRTLRDIIDEQGPLDEARALNIFKQILDGVGFAHQQGIIHRDLKPSNIMLDHNDNVKIMDFGIAKVLGDRNLTRTGTKLGTIYYMSPEQIRAEKDVDQRTDIYSLGILLYEMLTGRLPFNADTASDFAVMNEIVHREFPWPDSMNGSVSKRTVSALFKMIQKNREERFATCYQCSSALGEDPGNGVGVPVITSPKKDSLSNQRTIEEKATSSHITPAQFIINNDSRVTFVLLMVALTILGYYCNLDALIYLFYFNEDYTKYSGFIDNLGSYLAWYSNINIGIYWAIVGSLQALILSKYFKKAYLWGLLTTAGSFAGTYLSQYIFKDKVFTVAGAEAQISEFFIFFIIGLFQLIYFYRRTKLAWIWPVLLGFADFLCYLLILINWEPLSKIEDPLRYFILQSYYGTAYALTLALFLLFQKRKVTN